MDRMAVQEAPLPIDVTVNKIYEIILRRRFQSMNLRLIFTMNFSSSSTPKGHSIQIAQQISIVRHKFGTAAEQWTRFVGHSERFWFNYNGTSVGAGIAKYVFEALTLFDRIEFLINFYLESCSNSAKRCRKQKGGIECAPASTSFAKSTADDKFEL